MISPGPRSTTLGFIKAGRNPDGGWGFRPGRRSAVEPTAFCAMALLAGAEREAAGPGLAFLQGCQGPSGALGAFAGDRSGSWMAYAGLLAYRAFGAGAEQARSIDWLLKLEDASGRFTPADLKAIAGTYRYDASIPGWSWTSGATAWVEPTALVIIALIRAGVAPAHPRIVSGVKLIVDRQVPDGGWNFGNPYSKAHALAPTLLSTSIALTALAAAGHPGNSPAVEAGLRVIERALAGDVSTVSLAWTLIALRSGGAAGRLVPAVAARLEGLRQADGSFRGNLFESALSFIALEDPSFLVRPRGERR